MRDKTSALLKEDAGSAAVSAYPAQSDSAVILDNYGAGKSVAGYLRRHLPNAEVFRLVSAYFSVYGYELLQEELRGVKDVRFLFGDPASVGELDPGEMEQKYFRLGENGLAAGHELAQKHIARRCAKWARQSGVQIRSMKKSNFLHGKMYLTESASGGVSVVGSSNFTRRGLGGGESANIEINVAARDKELGDNLRGWFDALWGDNTLIKDVKEEVLSALTRMGKNHAPETVYYKTLYELFKDEIESRKNRERQIEDAHLYDAEIWKKLFTFQKDGAKTAIARLLRHGGCILADSVGLGKTYTALAVIKFFELRNERVLVLCPKKLRENWALYPAQNAQLGNPFPGDRFGYTLLSHTDLSRDDGMAGGVNLSAFNWKNFDLLVIDESHNFRNEGKDKRDDAGEIIRYSRYSRLLQEVIGEGVKTKVLMLSATPVNTSLMDLRNQIYLMTEKRGDAFADTLGIGDIKDLLNRAQKAFKKWEAAQDGGRKDKSELLKELGADFFRLLGGVSISRSRRQIKKFYKEELERIGEFPKPKKPENFYPHTDLEEELSYKDLHGKISELKFSIYRPSTYADEESRRRLAEEKKRYNFNQEDREEFLIPMMRINFLKRLESSARSLAETLARTIGKMEMLMEKIEKFQNQGEASSLEIETVPDEDGDDEEFLINRARHPYHLRNLDLPRWKKDIEKDRDILRVILGEVRKITPARDGKLQQIAEHIRRRAKDWTTDSSGRKSRKMLIFTTFQDTAEYLYRELGETAGKAGLQMAMVSGGKTQTAAGDNNFNAILDNFAPLARRGEIGGDGEIDLLIATDCISEGQNLQDCDTVLNYDIHWNPVRLIQRFGRIDRIGSRHKSVKMINYWPTDDMNLYLNLRNRVEARMALADAAGSGADNPLEEYGEAEAQGDLNFRDEQLKRLLKEVPDLDELSDGIVMSDFTLDYFFAQLQRYLEKNKKMLEATPLGAYSAVDESDKLAGARPGVIFFLRIIGGAADKREAAASPVHPYYAVYIRDDGDIRHGCAHIRQVLDLFESCAAEKTEPLLRLCDRIDRETDHGRNMEVYDKLLGAVTMHIRRAIQRAQIEDLRPGGRRGAVLPVAAAGQNEFELVSWFIIAPCSPS